MTPQRPPTSAPQSQMTISDIYYVVFKHKWMILMLSALGIGAAIALYFVKPPPYMSQAKLAVRYVEESKAMTGPVADEQRVQTVNSQPEGVLESEATILTSLDVAAAAADAVGVDKILGKASGQTNREIAALRIHENLMVEVPRRGNVLEITYRNGDITLVQQVLRKVIEAYYKKHVEIHKNLGVLDSFLTDETDRLAQGLRQTEEELRTLKVNNANVISLEETRKVHADRYTKVRDELDLAEAELSAREAALQEMRRASLVDASSQTNNNPTNAVVEAKGKLPSDLLNEYRRLAMRLEAAMTQEADLLKTYSPESTRVREVRTTIASLEKQKRDMETANPRLIEEQTTVSFRPSERRPNDLTTENAAVAALRARITTLTSQLNKVTAEAGKVDEIETRYLDLQRKKEQQESEYKYYSKRLNQARVDSQLGTGKLSNINEIQSPSLPLRDMKGMQKKMAAVALGGIGGGLALAFLLELLLSQSVRKPAEIEKTMDVPVFLTIPKLDTVRNGLRKNASVAQIPAKSSASDQIHGDGSDTSAMAVVSHNDNGAELAPWEEQHSIHPYSEALRDRLVSFFEMKGMTHKPKLIALTSCSPGAGVTTLAASLAASLSETGEGNVLLVDLNLDRGAAHPFYRGKPACGLADVLEGENRDAKVQKNLYVVRGTGEDDRLPKVLPKRLAHLIPKLHASDYDYIIFDMPPVTQTSVTPRLAAFMDMVFLVVEGEKTNREWLKQASGLLKQSKTNVGAVFNKRREYTPRWLHQEF